jgi:hypothetical protein
MKTNVNQAEKMLDIILAFYDKKDYKVRAVLLSAKKV